MTRQKNRSRDRANGNGPGENGVVLCPRVRVRRECVNGFVLGDRHCAVFVKAQRVPANGRSWSRLRNRRGRRHDCALPWHPLVETKKAIAPAQCLRYLVVQSVSIPRRQNEQLLLPPAWVWIGIDPTSGAVAWTPCAKPQKLSLLALAPMSSAESQWSAQSLVELLLPLPFRTEFRRCRSRLGSPLACASCQ